MSAAELRLLKAIQRYPRVAKPPTYDKLADEATTSTSAAKRGFERLLADGFIRSWAAVLEPEAIGVSFTAYVLVSLREHGKQAVANFKAIIMSGTYDRKKNDPEMEENDPERFIDLSPIMECYTVTGGADFLIKVVAVNKSDFARFIENDLLDISNVGRVNSMVVLSHVKHTTAYAEKFIDRLRAMDAGS
jgi:Lrp/AsnC family transcriptional regulator